MEAYLDKTQSVKARARDLVGRMTLEEKASQLRYDAPAIDRLGVPAYNWWNEALHGVARAGTATIFPQAIALAAIFDDEYLKEIAEIIALEGRAKYNANVKYGDRDIYKGLTFWSPNINIFRDPRWGRGHETYGEDPYLTTRLGVAFIKGLQGDGEVMKSAACAKHFAVHSGPEAIRHEFDAVVSQKDLYETYLPAFEAAVKEAKVEAVMGAYNRTNGEPCCGSKTLLHDILRKKWGFDGHVVSDCWAIRDFHTTHNVTATAPESAAMALENGCDVNCGNTYIHMLQAYEEGLVTEEQITTATERLMATRIKLGMFDGRTEYDDIPYEVNDCAEHRAKSLEAAHKSMVLLKNNGILPLDQSKLKTIAVIGPNADNELMLKGNYFGTASEYVTIVEGIREAVGDNVRLYFSDGCHMFRNRVEGLATADDRLAEVRAICDNSDVVVLCLGMDSEIEGEQGDASNAEAAGDKVNLDLPGRQQLLLETAVATGKPVILVLGVGSALAINFAQEHCAAILNAWYPGSLGGRAVADILFGKCAPGGKLPLTFYRSVDDLPAFTDYSMKNRTYRYFQGEPLYPFGYGLTYSKVTLDALRMAEQGDGTEPLTVTVTATNTGSFAVEEVVQCYIKNLESPLAVPNHNLCAFRRVALQPGESREVTLTIAPEAFLVVNEQGEWIKDGSRFRIWTGTCQPDTRSVELTGNAPLVAYFTLL
ncbi:glycoside hydrolase family 3 C-terminal domain-containing protein [Ruminococcaceae bacterium OttesenSCG-928-L11]|nr:glycoside hydrolase family 3 C-terminal domain-containing protein [Ruminococcaceae bacterium OttesenSCG-928-L11]